MRLHRFYIPEKVGARTELTLTSRELVHQLRDVFRIRTKEPLPIVIFDGSGSDYTCTVSAYVGEDRVSLGVREVARSRYMPARKVWLFSAIVKKDNFETIVEKATELGVTDIVPIIAERTEKKAVNMARLQKIVIEASEQSGRGDVPVVHPEVSFIDALKMAAPFTALAFHTEGKQFERGDVSQTEDIACFIGPEGGWSPAELDMFHENKIGIRCLGPQVLRAETAVIAALSQVVFAV